MLKIKTVLKTAPATQDEEYDRRKRGMKELGTALRSYKSAMAKAKASVKRVVESLGEVCKVFDTLSNDPNIPNCTKDCTLALAASMDRIEGALLSGFNAAMDSTVLSAVDELKAMYDECAKLEAERNKVMHKYDAYREDINKKESVYQRKSKDALASKSYCAEVAKRDELAMCFEAADQKFKDTHDKLTQVRATACTKALNAFMKCTSNFMEEISSEFNGLKSSSESAIQVLSLGMHAEYENDN
ncbi:hypothetical protein LPMP_210060 [Leishmania panamensis]|uniref:BAR domain-containing protein n=3 Tax=Leishmania guyanensis species complex TaxID=38579 RepID=A0A088RPS4_LEIPA|nr:hypothetical protein LPMP_210060 [Leishmania panamensis]AIN98087.1 hypothetical protein LPMP_210060 [Leishmania panamensis]CCM15350.1 hypothetical protein, conserved [Leishmania guyanensis]